MSKHEYECSVEKFKAEAQPERERLEAIRIEKIEAEKRLRRLAQLMLNASDVELAVYKPEVDKLRNSVDHLTDLVNEGEKRLHDYEVSQQEAYDMIQHLAAFRDGIDTNNNNPSFRRKVINTLELYITVSDDRRRARIDCAIDSAFINLCEEETENTKGPSENVCINAVSHRRYTDRTPAPPVPPHAPTPGSPALA
ncbi:MAG: hypothetical protein WHX52_12225 [Anaerolineae bacterium]